MSDTKVYCACKAAVECGGKSSEARAPAAVRRARDGKGCPLPTPRRSWCASQRFRVASDGTSTRGSPRRRTQIWPTWSRSQFRAMVAEEGLAPCAKARSSAAHASHWRGVALQSHLLASRSGLSSKTRSCPLLLSILCPGCFKGRPKENNNSSMLKLPHTGISFNWDFFWRIAFPFEFVCTFVCTNHF